MCRRYFLLFGAAFLAVGPVPEELPQPRPVPIKEQMAAEPAAEVLEGVYLVVSEKYDGACVIRRVGPTWLMHHVTGKVSANDGRFDVGSAQTLGVAILDGQKLAVSWMQNGKHGVTIYTIRGKQLDGKWSVFPGGGIGRETLHFLRALPGDI